MMHTVDIAAMVVASNPEDVLVTYSLGSCLGITLYDPVAGVGGMIHCMLPLAKVSADKARDNPAMFVETGVPQLLSAVFDLGARRDTVVARVAGGSSLLDEKGLFRIGERNHTVLRKVLWKNNILIAAEDVGGSISRTMYLHMCDGRVIIKSCGVERELA